MAVLKATRGSQAVQVSEFTWNFDDTMLNTSGVSDGFATAAAHVFDVINLPPNAIVVGGDVTTETAYATSAACNIKVGDSGSDNRYLGTTDRLAAGRTALVPTGFVGDGENIRLTVTPTTSTATAGKVTLRVEYIVRNKVNEIVSS